MNPYKIARLILLLLALLLAIGLANAQTIVTGRPQTLNIEGFRGADAIITLQFSGTLAVPTVTDTVFDAFRRKLTASFQPVISFQARTVTVRFPNTLTYPENATHQLRIGSVITQYGSIRFDYRTGTPTSQTLTYSLTDSPTPITVMLLAGISGATSGSAIIQGQVCQYYPVANAFPTGYTITHNQNNVFSSAQCFRADSGQLDPLWRVIVSDANHVQLKGPPGETFTGTIILYFPIQSTN